MGDSTRCIDDGWLTESDGLSRRDLITRGIGVAGGLAFGGSLLAACGGDDEGGAGGNFEGTTKIAFLTPASGPASTYFPAVKQLSTLAVEEINASGGVLGNKVELIIADTGTDPQKASTEARRLVRDRDVKAFFQLDIASSRDAAIEVISRTETPYMYAWDAEGSAGDSKICQTNAWQSGLVPSNVVHQPMKWLIENRDIRKWAMLGNDYQWPHAMSDFATEVIRDNGGDVIASEFTPLGTTEFGAIISKLRGLPKDTGIMNTLVGADTIAFYKQWRAAGGENERTIAFSYDEQQLKATGAAAEGVMGAYSYFTALDTPQNKELLRKQEKRFGGRTVKPTALSIHPYDTIRLWASAAAKAESVDLKPLAQAYAQTKFDGPRGSIGYLPNHFMALPVWIAVADAKGLYSDFIADFGHIAPEDQCDQEIYEELGGVS